MHVTKPRILWAFAMAIGALSGCQSSHAEPATYTWEGVARIVAIGDVHGAYENLHELLRAGELIDANDAWQGGQTHLVSVGDLVDRGPASAKAMDLLMALAPQAEAVGGRVHVVMGNHEFMNITGDLRDVSEAEYAALGGPEGHRAAFADDGKYGAWIRTLPFAIRINDTGFAHGGFSSLMAEDSWQAINERSSAQLQTLLRQGHELMAAGTLPNGVDLVAAAHQWAEQAAAEDSALPAPPADFVSAAKDPLFADNGPLWYRGNAACHPLLETPQLDQTLNKLGLKRVIVGHTPTAAREITARLDARVYAIDTGMLADVYRGEPRALEILETSEGTQIRAFDDDWELVPIAVTPGPDPKIKDLASHTPIPEGEDPITLTFDEDDNDTTFEFLPMRERNAHLAVAAYKLDRHLGLHMVPASAVYRYDADDRRARDGLLQHLSGRYMPERTRQERGYARPAYCERGSDFFLLAAFDALIGMTTRGLDNLLYNTRTWEIRTIGNEGAFGTSAKLPAYTSPPALNPELAKRLAALNEDELTTLLGEHLKPKQITAILKRRDAILQWPREG